MVPEPTTTLTQTVFLRGSQRFEILSDGNLEYTFKKMFMERKWKVPLWQVDPEPERIKLYPLRTITITIVFGGLCFSIICGLLTLRKADSVLGLLMLLSVCFLVFVAFLRKTSQGWINSVVFHCRNGARLHLWFGNPDQNSFDAFCEVLKKKSAEAWENRPQDLTAGSLPDQLRKLHKLFEEGLLSATEFEKAKNKLLEPSTDRKIGF